MIRDTRAGENGRMISELAIGETFTTADGTHGELVGWHKDRVGEVGIVALQGRTGAPITTTIPGSATVQLGWCAVGYLEALRRAPARPAAETIYAVVETITPGGVLKQIFSARNRDGSYLRCNGEQCFTGNGIGIAYMLAFASHEGLRQVAVHWTEQHGGDVLDSYPSDEHGRRL